MTKALGMTTQSKAYVLIPLTRGLVTAISPEDFERVNQYTWSVAPRGKNNYYAATQINGEPVSLHQFLLGNPKHKEGDHINRFPLDNRRCNLRLVTKYEQMWNQPAQKNSTSKYKGVSWYRSGKKWHARIRAKGKNYHIGYFASEKKAAKAYDKYAEIFHGKCAHLNFPKIPRLRPPKIILEQKPRKPRKSAFKRKQRTNTSGFIGVDFQRVKGVWRYRIRTGEKRYAKSGFKSARKAAIARDRFIKQNKLPNRLNF